MSSLTRSSHFRRVLLACPFVLAALTGCGPATNMDSAETLDSKGENLYYLSTNLWPTNLVDVCWEATPPATATERGWVRDQVMKAWENNSGVQFTGWGACPSTSQGVRIRVADEQPRTRGLGTAIRGVAGGMILNFTFMYKDDKGNQPFGGCIAASSRESCIRNIAAHEFGHALGFAHEQLRPDTPATCTEPKQGTQGDTTVGAWDINSIMNYCNPTWNNNGLPSATDISGVQQLYGLKPYKPSFVLADFAPISGWTPARHVRLVGDMDGDGRADIVGFGDAGVYVSYGTGSGFTAPAYLVANFGYDQGWRVDQHVRLLGDVNGDGKQDIVGFGNDGVWISLSLGRSFSAPAFIVADLGYNQGWRVDQHVRLLGDVNHDGRKDIVAFGNDGVWVSYATGNGFAAPIFSVADLGYNQGWRVAQHPRMVADVNNDGRDDVVGFGNDGVWVSLATSSGLSPAAYWLAAFGYNANAGSWRVTQHPRFMADVNGDHRSDIVGFGNAGVYVSLSTGTGFGAPSLWLSDFGYVAGTWRVEKHPRFVMDVTRDGKADIVGFGDKGLMVSASTGTSFPPSQFRIKNFGYLAGGWRVGTNPILLGDVAYDGVPDAIGFGNDGVWLINQQVTVRAPIAGTTILTSAPVLKFSQTP